MVEALNQLDQESRMRIFFSVGEPSGDLHAANLIRHLKKHDPAIECMGYGGPKMAAAGCQLHFELTSLAVMFVARVLSNIRTFFRLIAEADRYFRIHPPDAVVLIDYSGFNWWIARKAKRHKIPVFYYGVPQVWAWGPWRIRKIRKYVDHILCKLPFEEQWFADRNCRAHYVGHPYFDELSTQPPESEFFLRKQTEVGTEPVLTLLPGSRDQEVSQSLPILLDAAAEVVRQIPEVRVFVSCYNQRQAQVASDLVAGHSFFGKPNSNSGSALSVQSPQPPLEIHYQRTPELMRLSTACMACSGSVSLELMYHRKPTVIVYKIARWAMLVQALLIRVRFITLVNLIAAQDIRRKTWRPYNPDDPDQAEENPAELAVMPEYLTSGNPSRQMARHIITWFQRPDARQSVVQRLDELANQIAKPGATAKAADYIFSQLHKIGESPLPAVTASPRKKSA
jgi:lipid-A-disaccharide synthase